MITQDDKKIPYFPLTDEHKTQVMRSWSFRTIVVSIMFALVFGSAGGVAATIYASMLPAFQKYVHSNDLAGQTL